MQAYKVHLIALTDPIKYVLLKPVLSARLTRWWLLLIEYEIIYIPQKTIKGQALANFLVDHLVPIPWEILDDFPDEKIFYVGVFPLWMMFFDWLAHYDGTGAGVAIGHHKDRYYHIHLFLVRDAPTTLLNTKP